MTPYTTAQEQRIAAHAARVAYDLEGEVRQAVGRPRKVLPPPAPPSNRPTRRVKCMETGQVFPSPALAAASVHRTVHALYWAIARRGCCGGLHWHYADRSTPEPKTRRSPSEWLGRPVVSDRGEEFRTLVEASLAVGRSRNAVGKSILQEGRCAGRRWRYATRAESRAKGRAA